MVGYEKNDPMTPNQKLIAGCISGVITRFLTQPLDVIKLRTQLQKRRGNEGSREQWFRTTRRILREEGIVAFWHGHNLGQVHSVLAVSSQFFVYEMATKYVAGATEHNKKYRSYLVFLSGIFAGCTSAAIVLPLEVIRVRQMLVANQYKGLINGAREVYNSGGPFAFYEGLTAALLQMGPQVGISFCVFGFVQPLILSYLDSTFQNQRDPTKKLPNPKYLLIASTIAGSAAGFVSKTITYPFDLAKRRLQVAGFCRFTRFAVANIFMASFRLSFQTFTTDGARFIAIILLLTSHKESEKYQAPSTSRNLVKCTRLIDCLVKTYQFEGFWGLYQGWKVTIYKAQLTSVVAFTSYELICYLARQTSHH